MANSKKAGVTTREIDNTAAQEQKPQGVPALVIGTSQKGPAFVPVDVANPDQFKAAFGKSNGERVAPIAALEWLRSANALTFIRVLGAGKGLKREVGTNAGRVDGAGYVVGEQQPLPSGILGANAYANTNGVPGRSYVLGAFMSESAGSTLLSSAGVQAGATAVPIVRGFLMAPSGVVMKLSSSYVDSAAPASSLVADPATAKGSIFGSVKLLDGATPKQEFVLLLNGHKGTDPSYPSVISASFDQTSPNYFANVLNTDPTKIQQAGHCLYAHWDVHSSQAALTGTGLIVSGASAALNSGLELAAFLTTGSLGRNVGSSTVPNFENFEDRYSHAVSPWIISQKFGGNPKNLFRVHSIDDGSGVSKSYKISIENLTPSADPSYLYGSFDLVVRDWADTDSDPKVLRAFRGCNLDPSSDNYLAKRVGDTNTYFDFDKAERSQKLVVQGSYPNQSPYVRVEMDATVDSGESEPTALPMGFRGPAHLVTSGSALTSPTQAEITASAVLSRTVQPPVPYRLSVADGSGVNMTDNSRYYWGVQFEKVTSLSTPNGSNSKNQSIESFAAYFPAFMTSNANVLETGSFGAAPSAAFGIVDCDKFNNNQFSLENIQVVTGSSGLANQTAWKQASYVRNGQIVANDTNKTRAFKVDDLNSSNRKYAKFSLYLQGGFDGVNSFDTQESKLTDLAVKADMDDAARGGVNGPTVKAYHKAFQVASSKSDVECKIVATPGIRHEVVTDKGIQTVETRFDAAYIMDVEQYDVDGAYITSTTQRPGVANTASAFNARNINSTFAAAYFPDVIMVDPDTSTNVVVPPSVAALGAISYNDRVKHPWFAPAGFARGALPTSIETSVRLKSDDLDVLDSARINPLVAFPANAPRPGASGGPVVWGQKTLALQASALDRLNVRRLLIELRREIRKVADTFFFEPNRSETLARFSAEVAPKLSKVKRERGIDDYLVVIDTSTTTDADIANNKIRGVIVVRPVNSIENIELEFEATNKISG